MSGENETKAAEPELRWWSVPYSASYRGTTTVEARTAEEAVALVESGDFEDHPGAERYNWAAEGKARPE